MQMDSQQESAEIDMGALLEEHLEGHAECTARRGDIRVGYVIEVTDEGALVDVGLKREGFANKEDLERLARAGVEEIKAGDKVPVMIVSFDAEGYVNISIYQAKMEEDWIKAEEMLQSGEMYETTVTGYNRGGLTVQFGRIRGFVPLSHIVGIPRGARANRRRELLEEMVGQPIGLRVIEVDRRRRRLILSQQGAYRTWQRRQKERLLEELEIGQRRKGVVSGITDFGLFVDLGGVDGLVHISELAWHHVEDPSEIARVGDEVEVVVLEVDRNRERIGLSIKQTLEDPWNQVDTKYHPNQLVEGRITRVTDIGAFVELEPGIEGVLHVRELVGGPGVSPSDVLEPGQEELLKILRVEKGRRRIGLSARRVRRDEWEQWAVEKAARETAEPAQEPDQEAALEELPQQDAPPAEALEEPVPQQETLALEEEVSEEPSIETPAPVEAEETKGQE